VRDKKVHAECSGFAVIHDNWARKWYVESVNRGISQVDVADAAARAIAAETLGGTIYTGLPGGTIFDRHVKRLRAEDTNGTEDAEDATADAATTNDDGAAEDTAAVPLAEIGGL